MEINNKKSKPKKNTKTNKKKVGEKKTVSVNNLKNKNNEIVENVKKENCKIQEDIDKKNKKKKFCLFCCFNIKWKIFWNTIHIFYIFLKCKYV